MTAARVQRCLLVLLAAAAVLAAGSGTAGERRDYAWLAQQPVRSVAGTISVPAGFARVPVPDGGFAHWLRHLPLAPDGTQLLLHDGRPLLDQSVVAAVIDIDAGSADLQQCADAVMRLRAEFLFSRGLVGAIGFDLFDGQPYGFAAYADGFTPRQVGDAVAWRRERPRGRDHADLRRYLDLLFGFASTRSLARELRPVASLREAAIGDLFIRAGSPGHAVIVVDMAENAASGERALLLAQGSMPARGIYLLNNAARPELGAWFALADGEPLATPGYVFRPDELRRF
jgi:hypothetical protein